MERERISVKQHISFIIPHKGPEGRKIWTPRNREMFLSLSSMQFFFMIVILLLVHCSFLKRMLHYAV